MRKSVSEKDRNDPPTTATEYRTRAVQALHESQVHLRESGTYEMLGRVPIGYAVGVAGTRNRILATLDDASAIVFGSTGSYKTASLIVPALLSDGLIDTNVICTSVKADVRDDTLPWRQHTGNVSTYDPMMTTGVAQHKWSMVDDAETYDQAKALATSVVSTGSGLSGDAGGTGAYFNNQAIRALTPLLLAANLANRDLEEVLTWVDLGFAIYEEPMRILDHHGQNRAAAAWTSFWGPGWEKITPPIMSTIQSALQTFDSESVLETSLTSKATDEQTFDKDAFVRGKGNTLYIIISPEDQELVAPVVVTLIQSIMDHAYKVAAETGGVLEHPLKLVSDETASTAPIPRAKTYLATGRSMGLTLFMVFQDMSQLWSTYDEQIMKTVMNNSMARIFLPGSMDSLGLNYISDLMGHETVESTSTSERESGFGSDGSTVSTSDREQKLITADQLREMEKGSGLLIYENLKATRIKLQYWRDDPELLKRGTLPLIDTRERK